MIVVGLAVTIHGSAYVTYDLDFCYARDAGNLSRLVEAPTLQPTPARRTNRPVVPIRRADLEERAELHAHDRAGR